MALIHHSVFSLVQLRRRIEQALSNRDWSSIQSLDPLLMSAIDKASLSADRNLPVLIKELKTVVALYRQLLSACDTHIQTSSAPSRL